MESLQLEASAREVRGKKVKLVRQGGFTPVNLYGQGFESLTLQVPSQTLTKLLSRVGTGRLLSIKVQGEKAPRNVLIKEVQRWMGMGEPLHVSFYQVKMTEKVKVVVPIRLVGEAPAVKAKEGELILNLRNLEVECLPGDIPERIDADLGLLLHEGDAIHVSDLKLPQGVVTAIDPSELVAKVEVIKVVEEEVVAPEAAAEVAAEEAPAEEGAPAEEESKSKEQ